MDYDIRIEGETDFTLRFRALGEEFKDDIKDALEQAAYAAHAYMATHVPYHEGTLYRALNVGRVKYSPGASGGGGYYEIHVSVDADRAPHGEFVIEGTGIYNRDNPKNGIYPASGNVMAFEKLGEGTVFTRWTRGQEPQRVWWDVGIEIANDEIMRAIAGL